MGPSSLLMKRRFLSYCILSKLRRYFQSTKVSTTVPDAPQDGESHVPVMSKEVVQLMKPQDNQVYLDMTFGAGAHTRAMLSSAPNATFLCLDRDPVAHENAKKLAKIKPQVVPLLGKFSEVHHLLQEEGYGESSLDGVLFDVGVSSMQFDSPQRGFSISLDGPLDMRMDPSRSDQITAADVVNNLDESGLYKILKNYGEEKRTRSVARAIVDSRYVLGKITTTSQLANVVASVFDGPWKKDKLHRPSHVATKTFQALRIFVNNELNELHNGLTIVNRLLKPGGTCVAITFHSLEDRIVKRHFYGIEMDAKFNMNIAQHSRASSQIHSERDSTKSLYGEWRPLVKGTIIPDDEELEENPRSRSAKLRAACKV